MNVIRSHARLSSAVRRLLLVAPVALAIITGLLAMHTLTGSHQPAVSGSSAMSVHGQVDDASPGGIATTATMDEGAGDHCPAVCGGSAGMPDHSMLMVVCVLALLAAIIVLLAPTVMTVLARTLARERVRTGAMLAALPRPRPPSLLVLSISRT